ncbi:MAG: aminotransferase class V-fold PLP-dependent enzyme [Candidatus Korarchaeota archaeon]|nr:aminotransferase class V-fold PLP-dependent enzyme [Candidatus Korarchaeota archaeon]
MKALSEPMPYHRGEGFSRMYGEIIEGMKPLFGADGDVVVISGSSTAGLESALAGFARGKEVVAVVDGKFGERLAEIASLYAKEVRRVLSEWGGTPPQEKLEASLNGADLLVVVHNETSTGVEHDMDLIADLASDREVDLVVDVVSSIGGIEVRGDKWEAKALIGGVQKCIGAPPGLAPVMIREWDGYGEAPYYLDLKRYRSLIMGNLKQTPFTPALPLFSALRAAIREIHSEGLEARFLRHRRMAKLLREGLEDLRVELFANPGELGKLSDTVTSFRVPEPEVVREKLAERGIMVAGGQGPLKGKILRVATMARIKEEDVHSLLAELREILPMITPGAAP